MELRSPRIPGNTVTIKGDLLYKKACEAVPDIDSWWINSPVSIDSMRRIKGTGHACKHKPAKPPNTVGGCYNHAEFEIVTVFIVPSTGEVATVRSLAICSVCLYNSMSAALVHMTAPDFYDKVVKRNDDDDDPDSMYLIAERMDFLQYYMQEVVKVLRTERPDVFEEINKSVGEFQATREKE
jgi:hypothetical protein